MEMKYIFGFVAVICITAMEVVAMLKGIDGQTFATAIAAVVGIAAGLGGYTVGKTK